MKVVKKYLGKTATTVEKIETIDELINLLQTQKEYHQKPPILFAISQQHNIVLFKFIFGLYNPKTKKIHSITRGIDGQGENVFDAFTFRPGTQHWTMKKEAFFELFPQELTYYTRSKNLVKYAFIQKTEKIAQGLTKAQIASTEAFEIYYMNVI